MDKLRSNRHAASAAFLGIWWEDCVGISQFLVLPVFRVVFQIGVCVTKVIVIDDDRAVRLMVEKGLEGLELQVIAASEAMEGLWLVELEKPEVALFDVCIPEVSGFELFRKIRDRIAYFGIQLDRTVSLNG